MCTSGPDDGSELMEAVEPITLTGAYCRKCNEVVANVVLQSKFPYCRNCFISLVSHKYRSTLGKSKEMKHGDRVLVAYSGSNSSVCLLRMIKEALEDGKKKKIKTETVVLFIDETPLSRIDPLERATLVSAVNNSLKAYDFDKYYVSLEAVFDEVPTIEILNDSLEPQSTFTRSSDLFDKCKTVTSSVDLLKKLRLRLLYAVAKLVKCNKVFLAETSDHLAVNIIANVALGRGAQLPVDVGFKDDRFSDVDVLRPLLECSKKEVAIYNRFSGLSSIPLPKLSTKTNKFQSIQKLTEDFISNLTVSFPSTVHTIVATGRKLTINKGESKRLCSLCQNPIKCTDSPVSSPEATKFSGLVSMLGPTGFDGQSLSRKVVDDSDGSCANKEGCCCNRPDSTTYELCYSCQLIASEYNDLQSWPSVLHQLATKESYINAMRSEIKDFLL